jgi:hypothetical protein
MQQRTMLPKLALGGLECFFFKPAKFVDNRKKGDAGSSALYTSAAFLIVIAAVIFFCYH